MAPQKSRRTLWWIVGAVVAVAVILGAVLGGVLGSRAADDNSNKSNAAVNAAADGAASSSSSSNGSGSRSSGGSSTATSSSAAASATPAGALIDIVDLPAWNWGQNKSIGVCLGSWLILEKWMLPDWFNETVNAVTPGSGATTLDEWGFCQVLGADGCRSALTEHWDNWITEADFDTMVEYGINHVRLPTGFWAWIPTIEGEPFLNDTALYQAQIEKVLGWAYDRGMYVLIDAHGLPGSQNGEQASGHLTKEPSWFGGSADTETPNQIRSDQMVVAMTEFLARTPYRSVVTGLEVINEPRPYTPDQVQQLMNYYERSYQTIQGSAWPVATFLADGYQGLSNWTSFAEAHVTSPPSMVMVDHPYPGNFPPQDNSQDILSQVCSAADRYLNYPIPVCIDEWSLYTGVKDQSFEKTFYEQQLATWAWSAGGMYWSWRLDTSQQDLANGLDYSQYSFSTVLRNNSATIPKPADYNLGATTTDASAQAYLEAVEADLSSSCGAAPDNVAPYATGSVPTWTAEVSARSSAQGQTLTATSTTASTTATARLRKRAVPIAF
ncbi:glycoside hydrolase superfamily [Rhodotorula diobovata]|uniref:glucan 1,3-beta-glucosidase n=1 Tax=Rhodotorula diobovata TaxID=5288 RepID=A0A5C5G0C6_9BASI|nr:glycoside hydrolase superfamily [Rhodotorula diobovata]